MVFLRRRSFVHSEHQLHGIVLKQQPIGEADSLITWFTREQGKIRTIAVSARRMQSRLGFALLPGSTVAFRIAQRSGHGNLAKLIQATPVEVYVRDFEEGRGLILQWLQEVVFRATPDEQANEDIYDLMEGTLQALRVLTFRQEMVPAITCAVLIRLCVALGFGIQQPSQEGASYYFNIAAGGFVPEAVSGEDWFLVSDEISRFQQLSRTPLVQLAAEVPASSDERLSHITAQFFEYHIERAVRSSRLFNAILQ